MIPLYFPVPPISHHAPVIEAANRHAVERALSFDIAGDSSLVNDGPRASSAIDLCQGVTYIVRVVFRLAGLRKLRRYCWSRAKRKYDSHRSEHRFHSGTSFTDIRRSTGDLGPAMCTEVTSGIIPRCHVRFGSLADLTAGSGHVRFTPNDGRLGDDDAKSDADVESRASTRVASRRLAARAAQARVGIRRPAPTGCAGTMHRPQRPSLQSPRARSARSRPVTPTCGKQPRSRASGRSGGRGEQRCRTGRRAKRRGRPVIPGGRWRRSASHGRRG